MLSPSAASSVDESAATDSSGSRRPAWLGAVVPKRHARRAVTRSLVKRQVRAAAERVVVSGDAVPASAALPQGEGGLPGGLWIVRLRAPISRDAFPSAASEALRSALRGELDALFAAALPRCVAGRRPAAASGGRCSGAAS